jgi:hypothetical protein
MAEYPYVVPLNDKDLSAFTAHGFKNMQQVPAAGGLLVSAKDKDGNDVYLKHILDGTQELFVRTLGELGKANHKCAAHLSCRHSGQNE